MPWLDQSLLHPFYISQVRGQMIWSFRHPCREADKTCKNDCRDHGVHVKCMFQNKMYVVFSTVQQIKRQEKDKLLVFSSVKFSSSWEILFLKEDKEISIIWLIHPNNQRKAVHNSMNKTKWSKRGLRNLEYASLHLEVIHIRQYHLHSHCQFEKEL